MRSISGIIRSKLSSSIETECVVIDDVSMMEVICCWFAASIVDRTSPKIWGINLLIVLSSRGSVGIVKSNKRNKAHDNDKASFGYQA